LKKNWTKELIGATEPGSLERVLVMVPVLTGLRIGEVLGLTWDAVDLKAGVISVRRSLVVDHELGFVLKAPKSASSQRTLDMPRELGHELKLWRFKCPPNEQDLILPSRLGKFIQRKVAGNIFDAIIDRAGIRRLTFHKLRHTFASLLLSKGRDIAEVSRLLGHTTAQSHCGSTPISSPETRPRCRIWPQAFWGSKGGESDER